jgi:lipoprotein NlpI
MRKFVKATLTLALLFLPSGMASASGIDDANAAVKAARDGKYEDAVRLFTSAINSDELNLTGRAQAYAYRGIAKATLGDYDAAAEDLNFSVALDSAYNADAYAFRGYIGLVTGGDAARAAADLAKSANLKVWGYNAMWLSLARMKAHVPDTDNVSLANNAKTLMDQWPMPVIKFLLGQTKIEEVRAAANEGDPARLNERVCDADFYVAEYNLAHNDAAGAKPLLDHATQVCPFASFERMGAAAELMRLK